MKSFMVLISGNSVFVPDLREKYTTMPIRIVNISAVQIRRVFREFNLAALEGLVRAFGTSIHDQRRIDAESAADGLLDAPRRDLAIRSPVFA